MALLRKVGRQLEADEGGCWLLQERLVVGTFFLLLTRLFELLSKKRSPSL